MFIGRGVQRWLIFEASQLLTLTKGHILRASAWLALLESGSSSDISTVGS